MLSREKETKVNYSFLVPIECCVRRYSFTFFSTTFNSRRGNFPFKKHKKKTMRKNIKNK